MVAYITSNSCRTFIIEQKHGESNVDPAGTPTEVLLQILADIKFTKENFRSLGLISRKINEVLVAAQSIFLQAITDCQFPMRSMQHSIRAKPFPSCPMKKFHCASFCGSESRRTRWMRLLMRFRKRGRRCWTKGYCQDTFHVLAGRKIC